MPHAKVEEALLLAAEGVALEDAFVAIDAFPFGRYRLRLVPKDDPTPEVFS